MAYPPTCCALTLADREVQRRMLPIAMLLGLFLLMIGWATLTASCRRYTEAAKHVSARAAERAAAERAERAAAERDPPR